ncbi:hypothetical protein [Tunicatimonas pelagia]|uniref:hypothetical protein n=1 Tax=Tunicatimonas pelagia TaxID=931531 RepID=UPI002666454A|nr:hypothetical protein [Tunicatimonas pelagia]WKN41039.1 hypothetical protein P0M28_18565 [Tunicatimonas pelagia]
MKSQGTSYRQDRVFTEFVHQRVALPQVYRPLGWEPFRLGQSEQERLDIQHGIDRVFSQPDGKLVTVQERFRTGYYANYQDVTFRYRRDQHQDKARRYSEFYKIQADYLLYGILDCKEKDIRQLRQATFQKVVLLQLPLLWEKLDRGEAVIDETQTGHCRWEKGKLIIPVNHNRDGSSSFIAWDIPLIAKHWSHIIVWQRGFVSAGFKS